METSKNLELMDKPTPALPKQLNGLLSKDFDNKDLMQLTPPETQLRNLPDDLRNIGIGSIMANVTILSGYKGDIPDINIEDINDLLMTRFKTISLNELQFAFKIDRHGYHGDPTPHYQLFNAEFVAKVLNKFLDYKQQIKNRPQITFTVNDFKHSLENPGPNAKEYIKSLYEYFQFKPMKLGFVVEKFILHVKCRSEVDQLQNLNEASKYFYNWCKKEVEQGNLNSYLKHPKRQIGAL